MWSFVFPVLINVSWSSAAMWVKDLIISKWWNKKASGPTGLLVSMKVNDDAHIFAFSGQELKFFFYPWLAHAHDLSNINNFRTEHNLKSHGKYRWCAFDAETWKHQLVKFRRLGGMQLCGCQIPFHGNASGLLLVWHCIIPHSNPRESIVFPLMRRCTTADTSCLVSCSFETTKRQCFLWS